MARRVAQVLVLTRIAAVPYLPLDLGRAQAEYLIQVAVERGLQRQEKGDTEDQQREAE